MAEMLVRQWKLGVLRVRLDLSERDPAVDVQLMDYEDGEGGELKWHDRFALEAFGLDHGTTAPASLKVPRSLLQAVAYSWNRIADRASPRHRADVDPIPRWAALWLRLVPPYGYLGAVPWEEALVATAGTPVIRVPDRLPSAADPGQVWSTAVVINAAPGSTWPAPWAAGLLEGLHQAFNGRIEAHVFADAATYETIATRYPGFAMASNRTIRLHDPGHAWHAHTVQAQRRAGRTSRSPSGDRVWADWITEGLDGRAVRALHVVTDAVFDLDRPLLRLSPDPGVSTDPSHCVHMTGDEVRRLADTIGASVLSFGSPPENTTDAATRVLADAIGLQRPGPTFYSSLRLDPDGSALVAAHAFAGGALRMPWIPRHPSLFSYLQPAHVRRTLRAPRSPVRYNGPVEPWRITEASAPQGDEITDFALTSRSTPDVTPDHRLAAYYDSSPSVPAWLAASERYIDAQVARLAASSSPSDFTPAEKQSYDRGTGEALLELRDLIARHARRS